MTSLDAQVRGTYDANKRELFDAMRAYHTSEIAHKRDAIGMLTTLLTAIGAVFAAILVPEKPIPHAAALADAMAALAGLLAAVIVWSTNQKIAADNRRYREFGVEYMKQCRLLGLYDIVTLDGEPAAVKTSTTIGQGTGYQHTQRIVRSVGIAIGGLALFGAVFINLTETNGPVASPKPGSSLRADSTVAAHPPELRALLPAESLGTAHGR